MLALMASSWHPPKRSTDRRAGGTGTSHCLSTAQEKQRNVGIVIVHITQDAVSHKSQHPSPSKSFQNRESLGES